MQVPNGTGPGDNGISIEQEEKCAETCRIIPRDRLLLGAPVERYKWHMAEDITL